MAKKALNLEDLFAPSAKVEGPPVEVPQTKPVEDKKKIVSNETKEDKKFALRIDGEYYDALVAIAKREKDSLNKAINKAIAEYIAKRS